MRYEFILIALLAVAVLGNASAGTAGARAPGLAIR
jgi:hypothetical protein